MNDQSPMNQPFDRREARRQRRESRRAALGAPSRGGTLILGTILVLLGVAFLMQNMGFIFPFKNWGALFILIPAFGAFDRAWRIYRNAGDQLNAQVGGAILVGLVLTIVTGLILFDLNWTFFGPLLIILTGAGILVNSMLSEK